MVVIRLARSGAKKRPFYHIVVMDQRQRRDGRCLERIGTYDPSLYTNDRINRSTVTPTTTKIDTRGRARQANVVISSTDIGDKWRFGTLRLDVKPDGGR